MPKARVNGVNLFYEETGQGAPLVFVHEFAGDYQSWHLQVRYLSRRYRTIAFNARGYPPSDVPEDPAAYSQEQAAEDEKFRRDVEETARRFEQDGMVAVAEFYTKGPTRVQFMDKDPVGWREFYDQFIAQSAKGHALTMRGVQMTRPSVYELEAAMEKLTVPTLVVTGDEDEPCLEPALFMKRKIRSSGLVVMPKAGHTVNLEDPDAFNRIVLDFLTAVDAGRWPLRNPASISASAILPPEPARQ